MLQSLDGHRARHAVNMAACFVTSSGAMPPCIGDRDDTLSGT